MATYLVDFENVKSEGLNGIGNLSQDDAVLIFYSVNADKITFSLHKRLNEAKAHIDFFDVEVGHKNALDFQLASCLGYLIAEDKYKEYVIVSHDAGYAPLIKFWQKQGYNVKVVTNLENKVVNQKNDELYLQVKAVVEDEKDAKFLSDAILKYKTKQGLNNAIVKVYGTTTGGKLYNSIKPFIKDKKGK